ncbi:hypothetical protein [Neorhizobium alkalisoli]|uniref:Uncharacterized protein n=1 Tax=Neorhizobium alkalisoli TaxID=528178 RepID=A0A561PVQ7_9HYPH|nr:hypothetical protein [Neorhizobium alkalisoli]TWF42209.1 hypothetical protein FHW37_12410 [Neorhizobium alkalisoli]
MWVRFTRRHVWHATPGTSIAYKPDGGPFKDGRYSVTRDCASDAVAKGVALKVPTPTRPK